MLFNNFLTSVCFGDCFQMILQKINFLRGQKCVKIEFGKQTTSIRRFIDDFSAMLLKGNE